VPPKTVPGPALTVVQLSVLLLGFVIASVSLYYMHARNVTVFMHRIQVLYPDFSVKTEEWRQWLSVDFCYTETE